MALVKVKPTSPGRRALVKVVNRDLHKGRPFEQLVESKKRGSGRNNLGRITMRHQGGGHKRHYRLVDFRRNKDGIAAKVERLEYDPNRSANIALLLYADGERVRRADQSRQLSPVEEHPGRHDDPLRRNAPRERRADRALGGRVRTAPGA